MTTRVEHLVLMVLTKRNGETENCRQKRFIYMFEKSKRFSDLVTELTISDQLKNIAKGTTDPRVEFCLPK